MTTASARPIAIAEAANMKLERIDIAMLECLEKAPDRVLRWEDRMDQRPKAGTNPKDRRYENTMLPGLATQTNDFCDSRPDLTTVYYKEETRFIQGREQRFTPEPLIQRATIAVLEKLVLAQLIEHIGAPDEETAKHGMRELKLSPSGAKVLELWRQGRIPGVQYPDPKPPKAQAGEKSPQESDQGGLRSGQKQDHPANPGTDPTGSSQTRGSSSPTHPKS